MSKPINRPRQHHGKERGLERGAHHRAQGSGADSDKESEPGEREQFWVSGYARADGKKVEGYYKKNPSFNGASS